MDRLLLSIKSPVLEWHQVKDIEAAERLGGKARDEIGCWNVWEVDNVDADGPRGSYTVRHLNLGMLIMNSRTKLKRLTFFLIAPLQCRYFLHESTCISQTHTRISA